jgi:isocitrate dehydrogenase
MKMRFAKIAKELEDNEARITGELMAGQGKPVDIGGYYFPDPVMAEKAMRPSSIFKTIIDTIER